MSSTTQHFLVDVSQLSDMEFSSIPPTTQALEAVLSFRITKITLYTSMLFLSVFGNGMVIYFISRLKRGSGITTSYLILNLAVCDLATPIFSIPFDLVLEENNYTWPFGHALCKLLWPTATLFATSASLTLAAISIDRYRLIMHPFTPKLTLTQVKCMIVCSHVFSLLLVAPYGFYLELQGTSCEETWDNFEHRKVYTLVLFLVQYGIPLPVMFAMYTLALENLFSTTKKVRSSLRRERALGDGNNPSTNTFVSARREQNLRATKMFTSMVLIFTVCMLPNQIYWLWTDFGSGYISRSSKMAGIICRMFTYANSVFNPVIYATLSREFQAGCRKQISNITRIFTCPGRLKFLKHERSTQGRKDENSFSTIGRKGKVPSTPRTKCCLQNPTDHRGQHETGRNICSGGEPTQGVCSHFEGFRSQWNETPAKDVEETKERIKYKTDSSSEVNNRQTASTGVTVFVVVGVKFDDSTLASVRMIQETDC